MDSAVRTKGWFAFSVGTKAITLTTKDGCAEVASGGIPLTEPYFLDLPALQGEEEVGWLRFSMESPRSPIASNLVLMEGLARQAGALLALGGSPPDVNEVKRTEEALRIGRLNKELSEENHRILEASRMKSEFMASMSHELRTPLNAIIGFSQLLIDGKVGPLAPKQAEYLGDILEGGMQLLRLITDVLDLAKIESGKMQLYPEWISVPKAMREVCDILMPMTLAKGVTISLTVDLTEEESRLDPRKFKQVLYNLVSNAVKFSRPGGEVSLSVDRDTAGELRIKVVDRGIGIRKEDMGKLFQQFQQLDSGIARHFPGTGLGLVITKKLVELHCGCVGVESEFGQGSTFFAVFPAERKGKA